jgi:methylphosphotriester-DNA--protein-cysteine methyltransferase
VLEQRLESIFKIAKHFDAVLLLDEADAFMEQRKSYHDTHNRPASMSFVALTQVRKLKIVKELIEQNELALTDVL